MQHTNHIKLCSQSRVENGLRLPFLRIHLYFVYISIHQRVGSPKLTQASPDSMGGGKANMGEMPIYMFSHDNTKGPWASALWKLRCKYTSVDDPELYKAIGSTDTYEVDKDDVWYYINNNKWINSSDEEEVRGNLVSNVDKDRLKRGKDLFTCLFRIVYRDFKSSELGKPLDEFIRESRIEGRCSRFFYMKKPDDAKCNESELLGVFKDWLIVSVFGGSAYQPCSRIPEEWVSEFAKALHQRMCDAERRKLKAVRSKLAADIRRAIELSDCELHSVLGSLQR
jgi:hypothetical protein